MGTLNKTNKSALVKKLETNVPPANEIPRPSACIIDGMSLIQKMKGDNLTFEKLSDQLFYNVLGTSAASERVDIVLDVYKQLSIKDIEISLRGSEEGIRFTNILPYHKIQHWRRLLKCSVSKMKLIVFMVQQWRLEKTQQKLGGKVMYVTCGEFCYQITRTNISKVDKLKTTKEEADTRILLYARHASIGMAAVIIVAEDTDVIVLCLAFQQHITNTCSIFVKCGSRTRIRYIDIRKVASTVGKDECIALLGMHVFTGCDTVSAFQVGENF